MKALLWSALAALLALVLLFLLAWATDPSVYP